MISLEWLLVQKQINHQRQPSLQKPTMKINQIRRVKRNEERGHHRLDDSFPLFSFFFYFWVLDFCLMSSQNFWVYICFIGCWLFGQLWTFATFSLLVIPSLGLHGTIGESMDFYIMETFMVQTYWVLACYMVFWLFRLVKYNHICSNAWLLSANNFNKCCCHYSRASALYSVYVACSLYSAYIVVMVCYC
jgi:hypothetical protein